MEKMLMGLAIAGTLLIGTAGPAEARNDVYVCTVYDDADFKYDHYVDTDSIYKRRASRGVGTIVDVDVHTVRNNRDTLSHHYRFSCNAGSITYSIDNGTWYQLDKEARRKGLHTIYSYAVNY